MGYSWKTYKGKQIFYVDYSGLKTDEMIKLLKDSCNEAAKFNEQVLLLCNYENTKGDTKYMSEVKRLGKEVIAEKAAKTALIGITGLKEVLVQGYTFFTGEKNLKIFKTEQEATEWLIS